MDIIYFLIIFFVAISIGRRIYLFFPCFQVPLNSIESFILSSVFGFVLISYLIMILGFFGILRKDILLFGFFVLFFLFVTHIYRACREFYFFVFARLHKFSHLECFLVLCLFFMSLFIFLVGTAPLTGSDDLQTYFSIPKMYAKANSIFPTYWSDVAFKMTIPHHLTLLGLVLSSQKLSLVINVFGGFCSIVATYILSSRMLSRQNSLFLVLFFISTPMIFWQIASGSGDLWSVVFFILSIHFYLNWLERDEESSLYLSAFLSGLAAAAKYTLLISPVIFCFFFMVHYFIKCRSIVSVSAKLCKFISFIVLGAFPPFLRNFIWSGDPIYPLFTKIFQTGSYSRDFVDIGSAGGYSSSVWDLFLFPFKMILDGEKYGDGHFYGVAILAFLPLILLFHVKGKGKFLLAYSMIFFILMFFFAQLSRYLMPIFPVLLILLLSSLVGFSRVIILKKFYWSVLFCSLIFNFGSMLMYYGDSLSVSIGLENRDRYLERKSPGHKIVQFVNSVVPKSGKILLTESLHHRFYLNARNEVYHDKFFWANFNRKVPFKSGKQFFGNLQSKGFTHIVTYDLHGFNWNNWGTASELMGKLDKCCMRFLSSKEFAQSMGKKRFGIGEKMVISIYVLRE